MDDMPNPYMPWIREYSWETCQKAVGIGLGALSVYLPRFFLNIGEVTATIGGIGSIPPITETRFKEWVEIWKKCVMQKKEFWDMAVSLS